MPEVGGGSLSQCCQWLSLVTQTKLTKVHFKIRELVLASSELNLDELGPLIISDEVKAI